MAKRLWTYIPNDDYGQPIWFFGNRQEGTATYMVRKHWRYENYYKAFQLVSEDKDDIMKGCVPIGVYDSLNKAKYAVKRHMENKVKYNE